MINKYIEEVTKNQCVFHYFCIVFLSKITQVFFFGWYLPKRMPPLYLVWYRGELGKYRRGLGFVPDWSSQPGSQPFQLQLLTQQDLQRRRFMSLCWSRLLWLKNRVKRKLWIWKEQLKLKVWQIGISWVKLMKGVVKSVLSMQRLSTWVLSLQPLFFYFCFTFYSKLLVNHHKVLLIFQL